MFQQEIGRINLHKLYDTHLALEGDLVRVLRRPDGNSKGHTVGTVFLQKKFPMRHT